MTTPPTNADVDSWVTSHSGAMDVWLGQAFSAPGTTITAVIVAWTRADATQHFLQIPDPTTDGTAAAICRGLAAEYGAINVVVYQFSWTPPAASSLEAPSATQTTYNNSTNWAVS